MRTLPVSLLLFIFTQLSQCKRGGGGGFSSGGSSSGGSSSGSGTNSGSIPCGTACAVPPPQPPCDLGTCGCAMVNERENLFELPGLYYNGTITLTHQLTQNSAWDAEALSTSTGTKCDNDDRSQKTYQYPALFFVGPSGNTSDTNPIHWALRAFQPQEQTSENYLDMYERWIHIRSSDFVVTDTSLKSQFFGQYEYSASDATGFHQETHVYWTTNVSKTEGNTYSASAEYVAQPSEIGLDSRAFMKPNDDGKSMPRSSQYITLSDVCYFDQEGWGSKISPPRSKIPTGNTAYSATRPTVFLAPGVKTEVRNIGGDTLTMSLNTTIQNAIGFVSAVESSCTPYSSRTFGSFFWQNFDILHYRKDTSFSKTWLWNMTANVGLSFEGSLVKVNSTTITGFQNGVPLFAEQFERTNGTGTGTSSGTAKSGAIKGVDIDSRILMMIVWISAAVTGLVYGR